MADVASRLKSWSTTLSSNSPSDSDTIGAGLADNLQQIQATVKQDLASAGSNIASATTTDLDTADGYHVHITGTTTITAFGTVAAGIPMVLEFDGALTLTHNATSLKLPGAANITTAAGDVAWMISLGSGNWKCLAYIPYDGYTVTAITESQITDLQSYLLNVVEDTTPQLGGDLDLNGNNIDFPTTANISDCLDEDNMASDSATALATQQSIKAYVDANASSITLGTEQASTSGTSIDFTSIPAGTKKITVMFVGVSTSGTSPLMLQLGDAGGVEATNYLGSVFTYGGGSSSTYSTGFELGANNVAGNLVHGHVTLHLEDSTGFTWTEGHTLSASQAADGWMGAGSKSLSAELDRLRITTIGGSDTFDAGAINIQYE